MAINTATVQAAQLLHNGGLTVTSTSTPALNGVYAVDGLWGEGAQAQANAILLSGASPAFADGTQSLNWPDRNGTGHSFDVAQFHALVGAMDNFTSQCAQYAAGLIANPPSNTATIP